MDFQSIALPTELQDHWLRGEDLNLRPPGYGPDELPGCSTSRCYMAEEQGFEPWRRFHDLPVFKTGPFNHLGIPPEWWTLKDSNLRPIGYEPTALTN